MSELDLDAIQARAGAASDAPWITGHGHEPGWQPWEVIISATLPIVEFDNSEQGAADADFVAHARDDVPMLLDEVKQLRGELATVRTGASRVWDGVNRRDWTRQQWLDDARQAFNGPFGSAGDLLNGHVSAMWARIGELEHALAALTGDAVDAVQVVRDLTAESTPDPENWPEELLNARVRFWLCPRHRQGSVEWRGDVAHCLEPECGHTSAALQAALDALVEVRNLQVRAHAAEQVVAELTARREARGVEYLRRLAFGSTGDRKPVVGAIALERKVPLWEPLFTAVLAVAEAMLRESTSDTGGQS